MNTIEMLKSLNSPYTKIDPDFANVLPQTLSRYLDQAQIDHDKADDLVMMFANATCDTLTREEFDKVHTWLFDEEINNEWQTLKQADGFLSIA